MSDLRMLEEYKKMHASLSVVFVSIRKDFTLKNFDSHLPGNA